MPHEINSITLSDDEWGDVFDENVKQFRKETYANFFAEKINKLGISCVLIAQQKYSSRSLLFRCKHLNCTRMYKLLSTENHTYKILYVGDSDHDILHGLVRPLNGKKELQNVN